MFIPKKYWRTKVKRKIQSASMLALYAGSLVGCSVATSAEIPTIAPIAIAEQPDPTNTAVAQVEPTATTLPTATAIPPTDVPPTAVPTEVPATATSVPPTATSVPPTEVPPTATAIPVGQYIDGEYVGDAVPADRWGDMTVRAIIEGGELVNIEIVAYPSSTQKSDNISRNAMPTLIQEAISNQSADIDIVSRATDTSVAFIESLETALEDAAVGSNG